VFSKASAIRAAEILVERFMNWTLAANRWFVNSQTGELSPTLWLDR